MKAWQLVLAAALLTGCPSLGPVKILCADDSKCPAGYGCNPNGECEKGFVPVSVSDGGSDDGGVDGGLPHCEGVVCTAIDACHEVGVCEPATGRCTNPSKPAGSACDDG